MTGVEKRVMQNIESNRLKMKPRWWFWGKKTGQRLTLAGLVALAGLGAAGLIFLLEISGLLEMVEYGDLGWKTIFESLPYLVMGGILLVMLLAVFLFGKLGENYKKNWWIKVGLVAAMILVATLLARGTRDWWEIRLMLPFI